MKSAMSIKGLESHFTLSNHFDLLVIARYKYDYNKKILYDENETNLKHTCDIKLLQNQGALNVFVEWNTDLP